MNFKGIISLLQAKLKNTLIPEGVKAIYLYGSLTKGRLRDDSDIDVAILSAHEINSLERLRLVSIIEGVFTSFFKGMGIMQEVSILDLRGRYTSLQILYKIITEGIIIYESDHDERLEFENIIKGEYFDFQPYILSLRKVKYGDLHQKN